MRPFDDQELQMGIEVEMEHTSDPIAAARIAMDHLEEHPDYYSRLHRCIEGGARRNPSADLPLDQIEHYRLFHATDPDAVLEGELWVPGELVKIGVGVDVGYGISDKRSKKEGWYVHDFGSGVTVYRRAKKGERWDRMIKNFPTNLTVLGYNIGFSYKKNGKTTEVKGSKGKRLAVTPDRGTLVVVGSRGVEYLMSGGKMRVVDWIYD